MEVGFYIEKRVGHSSVEKILLLPVTKLENNYTLWVNPAEDLVLEFPVSWQ